MEGLRVVVRCGVGCCIEIEEKIRFVSFWFLGELYK